MEPPAPLNKTMMYLTGKTEHCVQDYIHQIKTKEQGTQKTRLNLDQYSVDTAEKPANANFEG